MKKLTIIIGVTLLSLTTFGQLGPCNSPNPPTWCGGMCGPTINTPINGELWVLIVIGLGVAIRYLK